ncbi:hypothetical protein PROFUN_12300 [Planoprotostelium fungivorum]|uniref:Uncharacterized protein n=1 Tax=Planoprotostelium fungivorum TaxID=1890364 RepID=A0A2P6N7T4_9EUKA|nr:hypothetical protein PROFUN_12300 [Planoprotostelium fungivorum]
MSFGNERQLSYGGWRRRGSIDIQQTGLERCIPGTETKGRVISQQDLNTASLGPI